MSQESGMVFVPVKVCFIWNRGMCLAPVYVHNYDVIEQMKLKLKKGI